MSTGAEIRQLIGRRVLKWAGLVIPLLILASAVYVKNAQVDFIVELRDRVFDTYMQIRPRPYEPGALPVAIIDIDEESLDRIGQWPWSRIDIANMVAQLTNAGAALVVFDVVFAEPDRTSLENVLQDLPPGSGRETVAAIADNIGTNDDYLARVIQATERVVTGFTFVQRNGNGDPVRKKGIAYAGEDPSNYLYRFEQAAVNLPQFDAAAVGSGSFNVIPDNDGIIRRIPIMLSYNGELFPSLAAEALRVAQGAGQSIRVRSAGASGLVRIGGIGGGIDAIRIGQLDIPTDKQGRIVLYDSGHKPARYIPAWRAVEGWITPEEVAGKILFVGTSAAGLLDIRTTPLEATVPGVEVHVQIVEQVMTDTFLLRPEWARGLETVYMIVLGLVLVLMNRYLSALASAFVGFSVVAIAVGASWYAFIEHFFLLDPVFPSFTGLAVWMAGSLIGYIQVEAERAEVRGAFSRYLSPALVERLAGDPTQLKLGGEMRQLTLMFCDIRGFTPISEQFDPQGLTRFINRFLTPMTEIILDNRGTIDKYMGDCIMAFWNAPLDDAAHARNGIQAALIMIDRLAEHNAVLKQEAEEDGRKFLPINIGIGLNTGECCVGNMGSDQRFDYSVLGDSVNLASRLEGQSKTYGVTIVIGEETHRHVTDYACLELDKITVKGKTIPVTVFTVLGLDDMAQTAAFQAWRAMHDDMVVKYRAQDWAGARALAITLRDGHGQAIPGLYALYLERIEAYEADPPGAEWDGVFAATSK